MGRMMGYNFEEHLSYTSDLYKDLYKNWQNKQGVPSVSLHDKIIGELEILENRITDIERIIDEKNKTDTYFDRTTDNPIISEQWETKNVILFLEAFLGELQKAMGQQTQGTGPSTQELDNELEKELEKLFMDVKSDEGLKKIMYRFEDLYTPKNKLLQKCKKTFHSVLDAYLLGTLTKEKALLLLQSKRHQLREEIEGMVSKDGFIEIDYEDGRGCIQEIFMNIIGEMNYDYVITKNNIGQQTQVVGPQAQTTGIIALTPEQSKQAKTINENEIDKHYFIHILNNEYPIASAAIKKGISASIIEYKDNRFNFKCNKGCVGLVFKEAGYTEYKQIARYILINGEEPKENTLKNCTKNTPPKEWDKIKTIFFPTTPK